MDPRRFELLRRRRLNLMQELSLLNAGELWHILTEDEYRAVLVESLFEIDEEIVDEERWREDES